MHILYVDDDSEDRDIFQEAIAEIAPGYVCNFAIDGREGFERLEADSALPDFIFVDVNMPVMSGKEFLARVKTIARFCHIPVIMYSTTCFAQERTEYFKLGAFDVRIKPASFSEICALIKEVINPQTLQPTLNAIA